MKILYFLIIQRIVALSLNVINYAGSKRKTVQWRQSIRNSLLFLPVSLMAAVGSYDRQSVGALNKVGMKNCGRKERQMVDLLHTDSQVCNSKNKDPHMHACHAALAGKPYTETAVGSCYLALRYNVSGGQVPALRSHFPLLKCYHKQTHGQSLLTARWARLVEHKDVQSCHANAHVAPECDSYIHSCVRSACIFSSK